MKQSLPMKWAKLSNKKHTPSRLKAAWKAVKEWKVVRLNNFINRTDICNAVPTAMHKKQKEFLSPTLK